MQQNYSTSNDNYENKKEAVSFRHINDPVRPSFSGKPSLTGESTGKQTEEPKNYPAMILHDIFGALNY